MRHLQSHSSYEFRRKPEGRVPHLRDVLGVMGLVLVVALPLWGQDSPLLHASPQATLRAPLVFRGVTVVDVRSGQRRPDQTVVIVGNRIQAMGPARAVHVPTRARVVDGRGKYLIPGLWDLHVHPLQYADIAYPLFVANGVTGVRDAGSNAPLVTLSRWKWEIAAGIRVGPRLVVSGQAIDGPRCEPSNEVPNHICVRTPDEARLVVDLYHKAGVDMIKTYGLSTELYYVVAAEARRLGMLFGGHVYADGGGLMASDSGAAILDHQTWFNPDVCGDGSEQSAKTVTPSLEGCTAGAQQLRRNGTWVSILGPISNRVDLDSLYMPRPWPAGLRQKLYRAATADTAPGAFEREHAAGIPMVIGTDAVVSTNPAPQFTVPGFGVAEALVSSSRSGMTPLELLQMATLNPALALRMSDSLGTVEIGKVADVVLLDGDPLADIGNTMKLRAVVADGRYYDRAALDGLLRSAAAATQRVRATMPAVTGVGSPRKRKAP